MARLRGRAVGYAVAGASTLALTAVAGVAGTPVASAATVTQYKLTVGPANATRYVGINSHGDIIGSGNEPGAQGEESFVQKAGTTTLGWLATPADPQNVHTTTIAQSINTGGQIAGFRLATGQLVNGQIDEHSRPLEWSGPGATGVDLGVDQGLGEDVEAHGINDAGQVVGLISGGENAPTQAWSKVGGTVTKLPSLNGNNAKALAVNGTGLVVGSSTTQTTVNAVKWTNNQIASLGALPGGGLAEALAVNASGVAVGTSSTTAGDFGTTHAVRFSGGTVTDLNVRGSGINSAKAEAVNSSGVIVGSDGAGHAFVYQNGQATDLNTLLPANSGFTIVDATGINDNGVIVGAATKVGGSPRQEFAVELTPAG
jgi:probable HAF family extracellular repeat protein